jgi:hypothetical protein
VSRYSGVAKGGSGGSGAMLLPPDTVTNRPGAGTVGREFYATDTGLTYYDNGSSWTSLPEAYGTLSGLPRLSQRLLSMDAVASIGSFASTSLIGGQQLLLPANSLAVGDLLKFEINGEFFNNSGGAAAFVARLDLGASGALNIVAPIPSTSVNSTASSTRMWSIDATLVVTSVGAGGGGRVRHLTLVSGAAATQIVVANSDFRALAGFTVDTTVATYIDIIATSNVNNAQTTAKLDLFSAHRMAA